MSNPKGVFVWRDFREDEKFRREKGRERKMGGCLVRKGSGKFCGGAHQKIFFPKWGENWGEKTWILAKIKFAPLYWVTFSTFPSCYFILFSSSLSLHCFFFIFKLQALSLCCFFFFKLQSLSLRSFFFFFGELQITPLKFGGDWILHLEVSKFRFYPLKFGVFGFYTLTSQILDFTP